MPVMFIFAGCSDNSSVEPSEDMTDELFKEPKSGVEIEIYREDNHVYTAAEGYDITQYVNNDEIIDGKHYILTADVTFLNGGVAGYVDYPQIDRVISIEEINISMKMDIDGIEVSVKWEDNSAVRELEELIADGSYEIKLSKYSDFEQVGSIGKTLTSEDKQMTTEAGDIVLYQGDQIVIFYGTNSWSYTKLGHIEDKSADEMEQLLGNGDVSIKIYQ